MTENKYKLGLPEKENKGLEAYEDGQWIKFTLNNSQVFYGTRGSIDTEQGTIECTQLTEYEYNEKGCVLGIMSEPTTFKLEDIARFRKATQKEVDASIENQSSFYEYWNKYVAVSDGNTTTPGKLHRIDRAHIQLLPVLCTHCGKAYIEKETPKTISTVSIKSISPSSEEELEHAVIELEQQLGNGEEKTCLE